MSYFRLAKSAIKRVFGLGVAVGLIAASAVVFAVNQGAPAAEEGREVLVGGGSQMSATGGENQGDRLLARKSSGPLEACLTDGALLSANERDLGYNYRDQLDKASVLCFQAGYENPSVSEVWKRLGVLAETKSFFVTDPKERFDLMAEAAAHFGHAARLEFEVSTREYFESGEGAAKSAMSDPYLTDLIWLGRLRRGEVTMAEIYQRHSAENLEPSHRPEFWEERALFIHAMRDPTREDLELTQAREDFKELWATMPVEVPWRGLSNKFGPQKFKKVEALEAWATGLISIASQRDGREDSQAIFMEALDLYRLALKMPLDLFEFKALASQLDQADPQAPDNDSLLGLWTLKDSLFQLMVKKFPNELSVWPAWGRDYYSRSGRQADYRVWESYFKTAGEKFQSYVDKSPKPDQALAEWGSLLELKTFPDLSYLNLPETDRRDRILAVLGLAKDKYVKSMDLNPERLSNINSLARILLKLSVFSQGAEFESLLEESNRLALLAISRDPNAPGAWLQRGFDYLTFMELGDPDFEVRSRLTAEAFTAFNQYLLTNAGKADDLRKMADRVWRASENVSGLRANGLRLLVEICQRLISMDPREPDYRFALGISLYCLLATSPNWPDDLVFSDSLSTREAFERALVNFETGLALLSEARRDAPTLVSLGLDYDKTPLPRPWGWPNPESREFLSPEPGAGATLASAGFQERFGTSVKMELSRLVTAAKPELLPPWYQYRLAALFRRVASSGYPPPVDQMAFFRLADLYLNLALAALSGFEYDPTDHGETLKLASLGSPGLTISGSPAGAGASGEGFSYSNPDPEAGPGAGSQGEPSADLTGGQAGEFESPAGAAWPAGAAGPDGAPGPDGSAGPDRAPGPDGAPGTDGSAGPERIPRPSLSSLIMAERGLLFAEMSLLVKEDQDYLLLEAENSWKLAEAESPGSSRYSKARWAAWSEPPEVLAPFLRHSVDEQINLLWPSWDEARLEPAFRDLIDLHWFKTAWFGYSR